MPHTYESDFKKLADFYYQKIQPETKARSKTVNYFVMVYGQNGKYLIRVQIEFCNERKQLKVSTVCMYGNANEKMQLFIAYMMLVNLWEIWLKNPKTQFFCINWEFTTTNFSIKEICKEHPFKWDFAYQLKEVVDGKGWNYVGNVKAQLRRVHLPKDIPNYIH